MMKGVMGKQISYMTLTGVYWVEYTLINVL